jgi:Tol biopolymer transport system component
MAAGAIQRVNVDTREVKDLTTGASTSQHDCMPKYAPDGSALAFARGPYPSSRRLFVQKLDKEGNPRAEPVAVSDVFTGLVGIAWWPERKSLITSIGAPEGMTEAVRVPLSGGTAHIMPLDGTAVSYPNYDTVRRRLVYQRRWLDLNVIRGSLHTPAELPQVAVGSTHMDMALEVSPDGKHIVFVSSRTGNVGIWRADRDGTNQILLASVPGETLGSPRWTPDGKSIICDGGRAGSSALYTFSSEGGVPVKMPGEGQMVRPSVSPDAKWVYYTNSSTGRREVYKMPFGGGPQKQLTHEGGTDAVSSNDGTTVFFYRDGEVRRIPATGGQESTVSTGVLRGKWTVADDKIYVIRARDARSAVVEMTADGRGERVVYDVPLKLLDGWGVNSISVSSQTGDIFLQHQNRLDSDLMLVEKFR